MVCAIVLAGVAVAPNARAECSRKTLQKLADTHVMAQSTGDATRLRLAKGASYAENDMAMDVRQGVLAGPLKVDFTRSFYDTTPCATFTEVVAATDPHPYGIHTRIEATQDGKNVSKSESVVTDAGDRVFGAAEHLATTRIEQWDEIPKDKRDTRTVIPAAADAYLDTWGNPASQMFRVEGGKNRYIHEVTVCTTPGCGRGRPPAPAAPAAPGPEGAGAT